MSATEGRSQRWDITESGEYTFSISNGGAGANYTYDLSLTILESTDVVLSPQRFQIGQGVDEKRLTGGTNSSAPIMYLFNGFEGQVLYFALASDSSTVIVINTTTGEHFESEAGSRNLQLPALPNSGEYRVEVSSSSAELFELVVTPIE